MNPHLSSATVPPTPTAGEIPRVDSAVPAAVPKAPALRTVKALVKRHRAIIRPVKLGHSLVGFRPANVEKLISHLSGEPTGGERV